MTGLCAKTPAQIIQTTDKCQLLHCSICSMCSMRSVYV
jgi:hypothetical protein